MIYKVVELTLVTDEEIEKTLNYYVKEGWQFEGIQFAMKETSKRPAMAFIIFSKPDEIPQDGNKQKGK